MGQLTARQEIAVASSTMFGAALSIVGSLFISVNILIKKKYNDGPYQRLLLGLCAADAISSTGWIMAPFSAPSETSQRELAIGNSTTCTVQGFFLQMQSGFVLYNGCLALHYLLTIRHGMATTRVTRRECIMHSVCWLWAFGSSFVLIPLRLYNELSVGSGCWIAVSSSQSTSGIQGSEEIARALRYLLAGLPCFVALVVVIVCNILLYMSVRKTESSSRRFSITSATDTLTRTKMIFSQAMWYVLVFANCLFWQVLLKVLSGGAQVITAENESDWMVMILVAQFFSASAGFGFLLVYFRPRYLRSRRAGRKLLSCTALAAVFSVKQKGPDEPSESALDAHDWGENRIESSERSKMEEKMEEALEESTSPQIVGENESSEDELRSGIAVDDCALASS